MLSLFLTYPNTQAQSEPTFDSTTTFSVPVLHGTISFAENGTYSNAVFQNNIWTFTDLRLGGSRPLENFSISAQNCNITVLSFQIANTSLRAASLRYRVDGDGKQVFNLGLGQDLNSGVEWSVVLSNNAFPAEGDGWNISRDGTITVDGANEIIRVIHWGFFSQANQNANLPFYEQHSVAIAASLALGATVAVTFAVRENMRRRKDDLGEPR